MHKYVVYLQTDEYTTEIDKVTTAAPYTAAEYIRDCYLNADDYHLEMLDSGLVYLEEVE